jgi:drug/metabolite transporter (DMT)-like permease
MFLLLSVIFVSLYGTGYIAMTVGIQYASPSTLLFWRFIIAAVFFGLFALSSVRWLSNWRLLCHMSVAGLLNLALFTMGATYALKYGLSASIVAIIIALQPIMVAYAANKLLGEPTNTLQKIGYILGITGVILIVYTNVTFDIQGMEGLLFAVMGLIGATVGSLYQKKYLSQISITKNCFIQSMVAAVVCLTVSLLLHDSLLEAHTNFLLSTAWMSVVVSIIAVGLFYYLIKHYDVSRVASLFYLIPVSTTVFAMVCFNQQLKQEAYLGIAVAVFGVILINGSQLIGRFLCAMQATIRQLFGHVKPRLSPGYTPSTRTKSA